MINAKGETIYTSAEIAYELGIAPNTVNAIGRRLFGNRIAHWTLTDVKLICEYIKSISAEEEARRLKALHEIVESVFGSEGKVKVYTSACPDSQDALGTMSMNCPRAVVQVAEPVALSARLAESGRVASLPCARLPESIMQRFGGDFVRGESDKEVLVSIGLFTIVQLERNVQMMIPSYDFCRPKKECVSSSEDPCELFGSISFPTDEFFPKDCPSEGGCGCGCR